MLITGLVEISHCKVHFEISHCKVQALLVSAKQLWIFWWWNNFTAAMKKWNLKVLLPAYSGIFIIQRKLIHSIIQKFYWSYNSSTSLSFSFKAYSICVRYSSVINTSWKIVQHRDKIYRPNKCHLSDSRFEQLMFIRSNCDVVSYPQLCCK